MSTFELPHLKSKTWVKVKILADSRLSDSDIKRLYIMDSTTISLFKDILKGVGRNPKEGKKKGGIKAHTIIKASENVPYNTSKY